MSLRRKLGRAIGGIAKTALSATPVGRTVLTGVSALRVRPGSGAARAPAGGGLTLPGMGGLGGLGRDVAVGVGAGAVVGAINRRASASGGAMRRRRAKGISGSEMKAFNRVTRILDKVCKTPAPVRRRSTSKGRSCR